MSYPRIPRRPRNPAGCDQQGRHEPGRHDIAEGVFIWPLVTLIVIIGWALVAALV